MSTLIPLTRQATTLQGFQLVTRDDMWSALAWLSDNGYTGTVTRYTTNTGVAAWSLSFADTHGASQVGVLTDWIVLENNSQARTYTDAVFRTMFATA